MKSKLLLLSILFVFTFSTNYAQSSASQAGIAVQGIARDGNNTALASKSISFTFELYYLNASNEVPIYSQTLNLDTDAFGVFSHTIDPTAVNNAKFANNQAYLRITKGTEIISNEKLNHVPYAISANNGVPTGSIMPFIGTVAPYGWALCDGSLLPTTATELRALIGGANAPNLQGMFLRGAGTNDFTSVTTELQVVQDDKFESHNHGASTNNAGEHTHSYKDNQLTISTNSNTGIIAWNDGEEFNRGYNNQITGNSGTHKHVVTIDSKGFAETRPVNYGVNYIIKL